MRDLTAMLAKFVEIVSYDFCNDTAKKTRFIQRRTSRLKGHEFAQAMMVPNAFLEAETLNSLATRMQKTNATCCVSASALCQKINTRGAEHFMKLCFGKVLKEIVGAFYASSNDLLNLRRFNRVLVEDSTKIELNEKLSFYFQGTGGVASKSAVKIDYIFDYLSEETVDVEFYSGNIPDQALACRIMPILKKDDLVLRDLGYYALNALKEIEEKEAFYISRFQTGVSVYTSEECEKPVDLARFLDQLACNGIVDVKVFIGSKKHPVRLVACQISEEALNKRHRDANRAAQRRGTAISKKKKSLLKYCIFITNVSEEILSSIAVMSTYRARWRIELIFKQWKSCLNLHVFKGYNRERIYCFLYGRLIMVLLLGSMCSTLIPYAHALGYELSCFKLFKYLIADHVLFRAIQEKTLSQFLDQLVEDVPRRLCMAKRKKFSLRTNVRMSNSYYREQERGSEADVA